MFFAEYIVNKGPTFKIYEEFPKTRKPNRKVNKWYGEALHKVRTQNDS